MATACWMFRMPYSTLRYLFSRGGDPFNDALDANDDGTVTIGDPLWFLEALFLGSGGNISGECAEDATEDGLTCSAYPVCPE